MSRQPPREHVPPAQRFRVRYAKRGRLRFASHRDFQRALERALRRAGIPMAYSAGFTPHPKISYANAAPTGTASEAEYLEIGVSEACDPEDLRRRIDRALPEGFDVLEVVEARTPDFAARLQASRWRIELPDVGDAEAASAVAALLATGSAPVERLMKDGRRTIDVRPAILSAAVAPGRPEQPPCAILTVVVQAVTPSVRPDDILAALRSVAGLIPPVPAQVTREMQGPVEVAEPAAQVPEGFTLGDPLAADREADQT
ncbi:MAG: TIGR03936 family radical SAM-associated protein [bacterium]